MTSVATRLRGKGTHDRLHLQHGPIDLILDYRGEENEIEHAYSAAVARFEWLLHDLVDELTMLRCAVSAQTRFHGEVAKRMQMAALPFSQKLFVTPMAAVAGAVADEVLSASWLPGLTRASVNNGGDIALRFSPGESFALRVHDLDNRPLANFSIGHGDGIGGVASSGRGGRSLSLGIADSVTVLADCAAVADVAATLIANAVDVPDCDRIERQAACSIQPDSDLGERLVVSRCGILHADEIRLALDRGERAAAAWVESSSIHTVALFLRGQCRIVGHTEQVQLTECTAVPSIEMSMRTAQCY